MTRKIRNKMKALIAAAAISCVLGGGAAVLLPAGVAVASPSQGADNMVGHARLARGVDDRIVHVHPPVVRTTGSCTCASPGVRTTGSCTCASPGVRTNCSLHVRHVRRADDLFGLVRHARRADDPIRHT